MFTKGFMGNLNYEPTKGSIYWAALESAKGEYSGAAFEIGHDAHGNFLIRVIRSGHEDVYWSEG